MAEEHRYEVHLEGKMRRQDDPEDMKPRAEMTLTYRHLDYDDLLNVEQKLFIDPLQSLNDSGRQKSGR